MTEKLEVLVVGATGKQGGAVARALLTRGHKVRALTRKPDSMAAQGLAKKGAKLVLGELLDLPTLTEAARGVDAVFGVTTPYEAGTATETEQGINLVNAIKEAGVAHFVFSSVGSADKHTGIPHFDSKHEVEKHIVKSGVPYTIVGPVFFDENWLSPWFLPSLKEGTVALGIPTDRKLAHVSVEDIGNFVTLVLERKDEFLGKRIDIASDDLTGEEVAKLISAQTGRPLGFFQIPIEAVRRQSADFAKMYEWFDEVGYDIDTDTLRRDYPEVGWTSFEDWAKRQDWSVLDQP